MSFLRSVEKTFRALSPSGRTLFGFFAVVCIIAAIGLVYVLDTSTQEIIPTHGGKLVEGLIGAPRFINPVLAISTSDQDLTALVYAGLLKATPQNTYVPDLAQNYSVSSDGLTYSVTLSPHATFSDGTPVTADDVVFTVQKIQDQALGSPLAANWGGVTVAKVNSETVTFTLKQPYAPFIKNLTVGILPSHLWKNLSDAEFPLSNLNVNPVGAGPFAVTSIDRSSDGIPSSYTLDAFAKYIGGEPYLASITFKFYESEDAQDQALQDGAITAAGGLSPETLPDLGNFHIDKAPLARIYGVFFNQNHSVVLQDHAVREALALSINKQALVTQVLGGYGTPIDGPLPSDTASSTFATSSMAQAQQLLANDGWTLGPDQVLEKTTGSGKTASTKTLSVTLATGDTPELSAAAQFVADAWQKLGVQVEVKIYSQGDLSADVISTRNYDMLLFGEVVGSEPSDLYAYWDSSQRNNPGLNIALYANPSADTILEQLRETSDTTQRTALETQFNTLLSQDIPAVFLYTPDYVYSIPNDIQGVQLGMIETPSDRFLDIARWYQDTDHVWPLFIHAPSL